MAKRNKTIVPEETDQFIVGLDIGTTKIATIIGCINSSGNVTILGYGKGESKGIMFGEVNNLIKTTSSIANSIRIAKQQAGIERIEEAVIGIAARHIKSRNKKLNIFRVNGFDNIIKQDEVNEMINMIKKSTCDPGETIITVIPQKFTINNSTDTNDPVGWVGENLEGEFQLITGSEREIQKIGKCTLDAGIKIKDIVLEPIASSLVCLKQTEKQEGVLLIDIGGGTSDMAIYFEDKPVFTKVIPIGGNIITQDIATVCNISFETAEKIKQQCGKCIVEKSNQDHFIKFPFAGEERQISEPYLAEIIYYRVTDGILKPILYALQESGYANRVKSIVLTGGGSRLEYIKELCQYTLGKPTRIGIPEIGFAQNIPENLKNPIFSTALGLLKHGINELEKNNQSDEEEFEEEENPKGENNIFINGLTAIKDFCSKIMNNIGETTE